MLKKKYIIPTILFKNYTFSTSSKTCYYKILNISTDCSFEDVKKSYLELAKIYHPDKTQGQKAQEQKFKEISEAYQTLSNKETRQKYDLQNGIISKWQGGNRQYNENFSQNNDKYEKYQQTQDDVKNKVQEDAQFYEYFENKYFKNKDFFKKTVLDDDPFEVITNTSFLLNQIVQLIFTFYLG